MQVNVQVKQSIRQGTTMDPSGQTNHTNCGGSLLAMCSSRLNLRGVLSWRARRRDHPCSAQWAIAIPEGSDPQRRKAYTRDRGKQKQAVVAQTTAKETQQTNDVLC
jgi:predicted SPOUT superfamily RNA methylase MTH1